MYGIIALVTICLSSIVAEKPALGSFQARTVVRCDTGRRSSSGWRSFLSSSSAGRDECHEACMLCGGQPTEELFSDCLQHRQASDCIFNWISSYETYSDGCVLRGSPLVVATAYSYFPKSRIHDADQIALQPFLLYPSPAADKYEDAVVSLWLPHNNTMLKHADLCKLLLDTDWSSAREVPVLYNRNHNRLEFDVTELKEQLEEEAPNTIAFIAKPNVQQDIKFVLPSGKLLTRHAEDAKVFKPPPDI
eukprot:Protomagalhaensia_sp_Gyna_25__4184@NODE_379_length_3651_cov_412_470653_g290_i0_p1_GENE_NODE_379_length_3651_cov_412_470653_g290_i0NODE_379_length_3651_cov_412_470653_g290_i0_p1_ORF_typecomplete_len248_score30_16zfC3HC4/PF00097_25/3_3e03zfC3HC4/PF00097_25/0_32_NODE_379_length_3651_cov_412_470653_g290_i024363179